MKSVLISIQPKWCAKIASGKKTIEVRKTKPKLETPFKVYIYQTKPKDILLEIVKDGDRLWGDNVYHGEKPLFIKTRGNSFGIASAQKVIGEFVCDEVIPIRVFENGNIQDFVYNELERTCLTYDEISAYIGAGRIGYGWNITDIKIYDKPRELSEFYSPPEMYCKKELCGGCPKDQIMGLDGDYAFDCEWKRPIKRTPQSWCYVEEVNHDE